MKKVIPILISIIGLWALLAQIAPGIFQVKTMDKQGLNWLLGMLFNQKIGWVLFAVLIVLISYRLYKLEVLIDTMQASFQKLNTWTTEQSDNDTEPYPNLETKIRKLCVLQIKPLSDKINEVEVKVDSKV